VFFVIILEMINFTWFHICHNRSGY